MLRLRFKKKADASAVFTAVRDDGTSTSTVIGDPGGFGPVHDLTHYVVETSLGIKAGFLGQLAAGRDVRDFDRDAKNWLPAEAFVAEAIAGQLSQDAMSRHPLNTEDFNSTIRDVLSRGDTVCTPPEITADLLTAMHARLAKLRSQWDALGPNETLELEF
jgi:hypothetical protein